MKTGILHGFRLQLCPDVRCGRFTQGPVWKWMAWDRLAEGKPSFHLLLLVEVRDDRWKVVQKVAVSLYSINLCSFYIKLEAIYVVRMRQCIQRVQQDLAWQ